MAAGGKAPAPGAVIGPAATLVVSTKATRRAQPSISKGAAAAMLEGPWGRQHRDRLCRRRGDPAFGNRKTHATERTAARLLEARPRRLATLRSSPRLTVRSDERQCAYMPNPIYTYGAAKAPLQAGFLYAPVSCDGHFGSSAAFDVGRGFGGTTSRTASNSLSFSIVSINKRQSLATVVPRVSAASSMRAHVAGGIESRTR